MNSLVQKKHSVHLVQQIPSIRVGFRKVSLKLNARVNDRLDQLKGRQSNDQEMGFNL